MVGELLNDEMQLSTLANCFIICDLLGVLGGTAYVSDETERASFGSTLFALTVIFGARVEFEEDEEEEEVVLDSCLDATRHPSAGMTLSHMLKLRNFVVRELSLLREKAGVDFMCLSFVFWRLLSRFGLKFVPLVDVVSSKCSSGR